MKVKAIGSLSISGSGDRPEPGVVTPKPPPIDPVSHGSVASISVAESRL